MKKWLKKGIAMFLTGILAFTVVGCNAVNTKEIEKGEIKEPMAGDEAEGTSEAAKGRYMETQLDTPDSFQGDGFMAKLSDKTLVIVDLQNGTMYRSADEGKSWEEEKIAALQKLLSEVDGVVQGAIAPDGGIIISYIDWQESNEEKLYPEKFLYVSPDGTDTEFELGLENYHTCVEELAFGSGGQLFAITNSAVVYEIDIQNQTAKQLLELESMRDLAMFADSTRLMVQNGREMYFYSLDTGEIHANDSVLNDFIEEQSNKKTGIVMCGGDGEEESTSLFMACGDGIYHHIVDGSVMEQLADGTLNNLGDPTRTPIDILQLGGKAFLILYDDGELYSYVYDPDALAVPEEQITIYGLYDNETVRRAISVFRKENPDVFVRFEVGLSGEDGMTENDAIHNLNTRLLAGEGPDLLLLNGLPMDSYMGKGILADFGEEVEALKAEHSFFDGILESYGGENGIYALPFRYEIPLLSGARENIASVTDLNTLADVAERIAASGQAKVTVLGTYTEEELLEKVYRLCADAWATKDGSVNEDALREFLTAAKRIYLAEQVNLSEERRVDHEEYNARMLSYYSEEELKKNRQGAYEQVLNQLMKEQVLIAGYLHDMMDYCAVISLGRQWDEAAGDYGIKAWNGQSSNVFCPTGIIGLNANSKNSETAKAFVKKLFCLEVQKVDLGDGFPVNEDAFTLFTSNTNLAETYSLAFVSSDESEVTNFEILWPDDGEINKLREIIKALNTPMGTDNLLQDDIISIGAKALTGEKEVDECVEEIVQKMSLRLQE